MRNIGDKIYLAESTIVLEGDTSLCLVDPGNDHFHSDGIKSTSVRSVLDLSGDIGKPVRFVILTHGHPNHSSNLDLYKKLLCELIVIGHPRNAGVPRISGEETFDGNDYEFIHTPGHSEHEDDISILFNHEFLFTGDIVQIQDIDYEHAAGPSPVPYLYNGDQYLVSLDKLSRIRFTHIITSHGDVLHNKDGKKAIRFTRHCIQRIEYVAAEICTKEQFDNIDDYCRAVFDIIVSERGYDHQIADFRKTQWPGHQSDYDRYDKPGIEFFVRKYFKQGIQQEIHAKAG